MNDVTATANQQALAAMTQATPVLVDIQPAGQVIPGFEPDMILTSGAPLPWSEYYGGQKTAILGGAVFEGLADTMEEADRKLTSGEIRLRPCHDFQSVGSLTGVYTYSMPVLVVDNTTGGNRAFCTVYEGPKPERITYGVFNDAVLQNLNNVRDVIAPALGKVVRQLGGVPLRPLMRRALGMGDELHTRNLAATVLFTRELTPGLLELAKEDQAAASELFRFLYDSEVFFLHLSMAAAKATADAAAGIEGSTVVTAMNLSCREFGLRVSGLGNEWFRAPLPEINGKLFEGNTKDDIGYVGGESMITETIGLGGFAQASAFPLQAYNGGSSEQMITNTLAMYEITLGEHPEYAIPYLAFRGTPTAIDFRKVLETGTTPVIDLGIAHKNGGQIGAGIMLAPLEVFQAAAAAFDARYPGN